jgi:hypothetical protein
MIDIPKEMHDSMKEVADRVLDRSQESPMWRMMMSAMQDVPVLNAEITRLREENARLREDGERLDWLEANALSCILGRACGSAQIAVGRATIDAAMRGSK